MGDEGGEDDAGHGDGTVADEDGRLDGVGVVAVLARLVRVA